LRQWLWRVPASVIDAGLAAAVAVAVAVGVSPRPGARPVDVFAYVLGLMIAALVLVRRRWPVAVLVASAAILHVYYLLDYPGISRLPGPCDRRAKLDESVGRPSPDPAPAERPVGLAGLSVRCWAHSLP
jgi:hypothetical protein